jgi:hypothetical protein
MKNYKNA